MSNVNFLSKVNTAAKIGVSVKTIDRYTGRDPKYPKIVDFPRPITVGRREFFAEDSVEKFMWNRQKATDA